MSDQLYILHRVFGNRASPEYFLVIGDVDNPHHALLDVAKQVYHRIGCPKRYDWEMFFKHAQPSDFEKAGLKRLKSVRSSRTIHDAEILYSGGDLALQEGDRVRVRSSGEKGLISGFNGDNAFLELFGSPNPPLYVRPINDLERV